MDNQKKVYIAGPMRGHIRFNHDAFHRAQRAWEAAGWQVISPAAMAEAVGFDPDCTADVCDAAYMQYVLSSDLVALWYVDAIALLPGWENSVGVTLELALAQARGIPAYDAITMEQVHPVRCPWGKYKEERKTPEPATSCDG